MNKFKIPHADLSNLTLEDLQSDLNKRVKESEGTSVAYSHETVQTLITQVALLREAIQDSIKALDETASPEFMNQTSAKMGRDIMRKKLLSVREDLARSAGIRCSINADTDW